MTAHQKFTAKMNALTEAQAVEAYTALRQAVAAHRRRGQRAPEDVAAAMVLAGEALESRIGEDRFDALMAEIDARAYS